MTITSPSLRALRWCPRSATPSLSLPRSSASYNAPQWGAFLLLRFGAAGRKVKTDDPRAGKNRREAMPNVGSIRILGDLPPLSFAIGLYHSRLRAGGLEKLFKPHFATEDFEIV